MDRQKLAPHVKEVARALTIQMSEEEIAGELSEYVEKFGIPLDQAKRSMVAKYGGEVSNMRTSTKKTVAEVTGDERSLDLTVRVLAATRRTVTVSGNDKEIISGILADDTGTIPFTCWDGNVELEKGDTVDIRNAYAKVFRDEAQVNLGDRTSLRKVDSSMVPPYQPKAVEKSIGELRIGDRNVTVKARIVDIDSREITTQDGRTKTMFTGTLADESGRMPFTAWHDFSLDSEDGVVIKGAYVKRWRGSPQLVFDENSSVEKNDGAPAMSKLARVEVVPMDVLAEREGGIDVIVQGTVVDVRKGSGIIYRCPECRRVTDDRGECKLHGEVDGEVDLRIKGILDDGRGALTFFLDRSNTEKVTGITLDELLSVSKMPEAKSLKRMEDTLITRDLILKGNATKEEYGLTLIVKSAKLKEEALVDDARKLLNAMEVYL